MPCNNCENCKSQPPVETPSNIHYMLVRVDTDRKIEEIIDFVEKLENNISGSTCIDVEQISSLSSEEEEQDGGPVIYFP